MKRYLIFVIVFVLVTLNHLKPFLYKDSGKNIKVSSAGNIFGHKSLTVVESEESHINGILNFTDLQKWNYSTEVKSECPTEIQNISNKKVIITGFMYPLSLSTEITSFCLLKTTQTCCYGPKPQYNQYIFVETKTPVKFERFAPVTINGRFFVDEKPEDGYIYRFEADHVNAVNKKTKEININALAQTHNLPIFDYKILETESLSQIDEKTYLIEGYITGRDKNEIYLSENYWDGVSNGIMPNPINTIVVYPASADNLPEMWEQKAIFEGDLKNQVVNGKSIDKTGSLVIMKNAKLQGKIKENFLNKGFVSIKIELILVGLFISIYFFTVKSRKNKILLLLFSLLLALTLQAEDKVVAKVNGKNIYQSQIDKVIPEKIFKAQEELWRRSRKIFLIEQELINQELEKNKIIITEEKINAKYADYEKNPPALDMCCSYGTLDQYLTANGISREVFKEQIEMELGLDTLLTRKWIIEKSKLVSNEDRSKIRDLYIKAWHIFFNVYQAPGYYANPSEITQAKRELSNEVYLLLKNGLTYEEAVAKYSDDANSVNKNGYIGLISKSLFGQEVEKVFNELEYNVASSPIESRFGFHIIKKGKISQKDIDSVLIKEFVLKNKYSFMKSIQEKAVIEKY